MESPLNDHDAFLGKVAHLLQLEKKAQEVSLLATGKVHIEQTDYNSWDNGCEIYTIFIDIPSTQFIELGNRIDSLQQEILKEAQFLLRLIQGEAIAAVVISPDIPYDPEWREKITKPSPTELIQEEQGFKPLTKNTRRGKQEFGLG
jgi:hypothetical protein